MKIKFTYAGALVLLTSLFSTALSAQNHYRSIADGNWTATNVWEASADGITGWAATATAPITSDLTIQVRNSITVNSNVSADQLTITNTGHLTVTGTNGVLQLANGTGDDLTVNGILQIDNFAANAVSGPGNILINGTLTWIGGIISAPAVISGSGQANLSGNNVKYLRNTLVNNGVFNWSTGASTGGIFMNNGTFTNNGTINENFSSDRGFFSEGGTNQFTNNGTFHKQTSFIFNNLTVPFTNSATGILSGTGTFNLANTVSNLGRIRPGNSPGLLTVSSAALNNQATTIDLEILNNSGAGTGYDQLTITAGTPNLSNAIINVLDISPGNNPAPLGNYNNLISGSFTALNSANVNVRTNYSKAATTTTALAVQKVALFPLPVVWGEFNAVAKNNEVVLNWETLSEVNTASFVIEHATGNNAGYTPVATIAAQGNSNTIKKYEYRFNSPDKEKSNFFRIKQVDLDGKSKYSDVRIVKFNKGNIVKVSTYPNPVISELNINVQVSNIAVSLSDMYGKTILTTLLKAGTNTINMQPYAKGYYLVGIYEDGILLETRKVVKQ